VSVLIDPQTPPRHRRASIVSATSATVGGLLVVTGFAALVGSLPISEFLTVQAVGLGLLAVAAVARSFRPQTTQGWRRTASLIAGHSVVVCITGLLLYANSVVLAFDIADGPSPESWTSSLAHTFHSLQNLGVVLVVAGVIASTAGIFIMLARQRSTDRSS
jgi:hypothetical protein